MALTTGWLNIERGTGNAMKIPMTGVPPWSFNVKDKLLFQEDYPLDIHIAYSTNKITRKIQCFGLIFDTQADIELFIATLKTLNVAGNMTLELQTTNTPTYFKVDGTNTSIEVLYESYKGVHPAALGGQSTYKVESIQFVQSG